VSEPLGPFSAILLVVPATALWVAVRALYGRKRRAAADPMQVLLSLASAIMYTLAVLSVIFGLAAPWVLHLPPILAIFFGLIVLGIAFIFILMLIDRTRRSEHRGLVWALASAAQRGVPLAESARAYADETLGDTGARALVLAEALERGQPLAEAVRTARLRMGTAMKVAVRVGEKLGALGPAMRQQLTDTQQLDAVLREVIGRFLYLASVILAMLFVVMFVMLRIVPVFQRIFEEFNVQLPPLTNLVIHSGRWFTSIGWLPFTLLVLLPAPFVVLGAVMYYVGFVPRNLPLVWRLFRRYDGALVMRALALAVRRNVPLIEAMNLVAEQYPIGIIGQRLKRVAGLAAGGAEWTQTMRAHELIGQADAAVLKSAERVGNLAWALEEMADRALRREIYRVQVLLQILFPALLLAVASVVFVFAIGLFLPLVKLIEALA
jgi:type II secretory pathway component PulF